MRTFLFLFAFAFALTCIPSDTIAGGLPSAPIWLRQTGITYDTANNVYSVIIEFQHGKYNSHDERASAFNIYRSMVGLTDKDEEFDLVGTVSGDNAKPEAVTFTDVNVKRGVYWYFVKPMGMGVIGERSEKAMIVAPGSYCVNMSSPQLSFTSFPSMVAIPGTKYSYEAYAQHRSLRAQGFVRYELIEGPNGLTVDSKSGLVEWNTPADANGNYFVKVRTYSEDSKTAEAFQEWYIRFGNSDEIKTAIVSGVQEDAVTKAFLMPNPAENVLSLQCESKTTSNATLSIINSVGAEVMHSGINLNVGQNVISVNVEGLPTGSYIVRVDNGYGRSVFALTIMR